MYRQLAMIQARAHAESTVVASVEDSVEAWQGYWFPVADPQSPEARYWFWNPHSREWFWEDQPRGWVRRVVAPGAAEWLHPSSGRRFQERAVDTAHVTALRTARVERSRQQEHDEVAEMLENNGVYADVDAAPQDDDSSSSSSSTADGSDGSLSEGGCFPRPCPLDEEFPELESAAQVRILALEAEVAQLRAELAALRGP